MERLEPRWLKLLGGDEWIEATTNKDTRWLAALRRLDRSGDASLLVKLLRSDEIEMPSGIEMSPTARELVADSLERWRVKKRDQRLITLFKPSAEDRFDDAAETVRSMSSGVATVLDEEQLKLLPRELRRRWDRGELTIEETVRALRAVQAGMTEAERIDAVARVSRINPGSLAQHVRGKVGFGRGKKRPVASK